MDEGESLTSPCLNFSPIQAQWLWEGVLLSLEGQISGVT